MQESLWTSRRRKNTPIAKGLSLYLYRFKSFLKPESLRRGDQAWLNWPFESRRFERAGGAEGDAEVTFWETFVTTENALSVTDADKVRKADN